MVPVLPEMGHILRLGFQESPKTFFKNPPFCLSYFAFTFYHWPLKSSKRCGDTNPTPANCPTFQDCTSRILQAHAVLQRTSKLAQKKDKQINMSLPHLPDLRSISAMGFPDSSVGKKSVCNAGDSSLIPGEGIKYGPPLQYSGLENSMDCAVHGVAKSWRQLSDFHFQ